MRTAHRTDQPADLQGRGRVLRADPRGAEPAWPAMLLGTSAIAARLTAAATGGMSPADLGAEAERLTAGPVLGWPARPAGVRLGDGRTADDLHVLG
jgi:hypothetical protein